MKPKYVLKFLAVRIIHIMLYVTVWYAVLSGQCYANGNGDIGDFSVSTDTLVEIDSAFVDSVKSSVCEIPATEVKSSNGSDSLTSAVGKENDDFWNSVIIAAVGAFLGGLCLLIIQKILGWKSPVFSNVIIVILPTVTALIPGPLDDLLLRLIIGAIGSVGVARLTKQNES